MRNTVLVRDGAGGWRQPEVTAFTNERALQTLVNESPHLLTGDPLATVAEFRIPGIGFVDLVGVDPDGGITIVECKLRANPEIRREVVGQILAYAGGLWRMSYDDFETTWQQRSQRQLHDHVSDKAESAVDPDELRRGVSKSLALGAFTLIIAVDDITDELKGAIEFLNTATRPEVRVFALELQYVKDGGTEIFILRTYGEEAKPAPPGRTKWNAETFGAAVAVLPTEQRQALERLLAHGRSFGERPWWGVGQSPGISYYYRVGQQPVSLFQLYLRPTGPVVAVSIGAVSAHKSLGRAAALQFLQDLQRIDRLQPALGGLTESDLSRFPSIPVAGVLDDDAVVDAFLSVIDRVRSSDQSNGTAVAG